MAVQLIIVNMSFKIAFLFVQVHVRQHHLHLSHHDGDHAGVPTNQNSLHRGFHFQGSRCFSRRNRSTFSTDLTKLQAWAYQGCDSFDARSHSRAV